MRQRTRDERSASSRELLDRILQLLYVEEPGSTGGQIRALASLESSQAPVPTEIRFLLSHDTRVARRVYRKAQRDGSAIHIPVLEEGTPSSMRRAIAARWGADCNRPRITLKKLRERSRPSLADDALVDWILGDARTDESNWRRLSTFGLIAEAYLTDMLILREVLDDLDAMAELRRLDGRLSRLVDAESLAILDTLPRDRGLLICGTHAGAFKFGYQLLHAKFPGMTVLTGGEVNGNRTNVDRVRALYALTKDLRKPGTVVLMGADGRNGDSNAFVQVRDLAVPIRFGAATLAFNARCASVFFMAKWVDLTLVIECVPVPAIAQGATLSDWSAEWLRSYGAVLTDLLSGNAANVHGTWGIWRSISETLAMREPARLTA